MQTLLIIVLILFCILLGGGIVYLLIKNKNKDNDNLTKQDLTNLQSKLQAQVNQLASQPKETEKVYVPYPTSYYYGPRWRSGRAWGWLPRRGWGGWRGGWRR